ncbi:MAG: O-antigen biosynthesis protein, partial [Thiobacillaceae bacterium]|nr:O-antigen biosynthesis protein [Thiobacillaceae bacterium]
ADRQGCGEYRIIAPMRVLNAQGRLMGWETGSYLGPAELARMQPDSIVLQRQVTEEQIRLIEQYRAYSSAFRVFEIDDLITNVPIKSPVRQKLVEQKDLYKRFRKAVSLCDRFVVSTEYLAETYRDLGPPVVVVQNHLEGAVWLKLPRPKRREGKPRVGWAGAGQHHGDLAILTEVIKATAKEVDWVFLGMCLDEARPYVKEFHPGVPIEQYPAKLASLDLDLAVAPLEDVPFNHAKSHLRLLEYGILGYPVVCTDLTPYRGDYPVTRVPNRFKAWCEAILERVRDRDALHKEGERLRDYICREWILEDHSERWLQAWLAN